MTSLRPKLSSRVGDGLSFVSPALGGKSVSVNVSSSQSHVQAKFARFVPFFHLAVSCGTYGVLGPFVTLTLFSLSGLGGRGRDVVGEGGEAGGIRNVFSE